LGIRYVFSDAVGNIFCQFYGNGIANHLLMLSFATKPFETFGKRLQITPLYCCQQSNVGAWFTGISGVLLMGCPKLAAYTSHDSFQLS
jgi:hypothetical protein